MIVTQVIGGLGNQMFQYAAAKSVGEKLNETTKLDVSAFSTYKLHQGFELDRIFKGPFNIASSKDLSKVLGLQKSGLLRKIALRPSMKIFRSKNFLLEQDFLKSKFSSQINNDLYMIGYWQSANFFEEISDQIRTDFQFKIDIYGENVNVLKKMENVNSVAIHIRRGDYVTNPDAAAVHGVCSLDYYQRAINYMAENVDDPSFFIFSDDQDWVKIHLKIAYPHTFVSHNVGAESYNDMRLMSLCKHNIIANSTFSWWGAWLNRHPEKIVIAPQKWFNKSEYKSDLLPSDWIVL